MVSASVVRGLNKTIKFSLHSLTLWFLFQSNTTAHHSSSKFVFWYYCKILEQDLLWIECFSKQIELAVRIWLFFCNNMKKTWNISRFWFCYNIVLHWYARKHWNVNLKDKLLLFLITLLIGGPYIFRSIWPLILPEGSHYWKKEMKTIYAASWRTFKPQP